MAEIPQVIALGPEMVVDDVEHDRHPPTVAGVHEPFQPPWPAVRVLGGKGIDAVVAPVAAAGKLGHRHEFDGGDAQGLEVVQMRYHGVERSLGGEGAHVQFVDDVA